MHTKADIISTAATRIREARIQTGMTQDMLGGLVYVNPTAIRSMEFSGKGSLPLIGAVLSALLEFEGTQALGEAGIALLRASYDEIRMLVGQDITPHANIYPLTPAQIRGIRKLLGMTQTQLAKELLLSSNTSISLWEKSCNIRIPRAFYRARLVKLGAQAVGNKAGLTGKAAEDLLFSTLELMTCPVVQAGESGNEDNIATIIDWQSAGSPTDGLGIPPSVYTPSCS